MTPGDHLDRGWREYGLQGFAQVDSCEGFVIEIA